MSLLSGRTTSRPRREARPDPAELLERIVAAATDTDGADLQAIAELVGRRLGVSCCIEVWTDEGESRHEWPVGKNGASGGLGQTSVPIWYGGEPIGTLSVAFGIGGRPGTARRGMLRDVGAVLGPILHAHRLERETTKYEQAALGLAAALGETRRAAIAEQEDERRTLERNLHDGAQHHLVALRMTVGLLEHDLGTGAVDTARGRLDQLDSLLDLTENGLAATASGALPPALVTSGLLAAFQAELRAAADIRVEADPIVRDRRYPPRVEVAVFFACLEAVNNARKHASGAAVGIRLDHTYRGLAFSVHDDGPGFDPSTLERGCGLRLLADRIAAAGGELVLRSAVGAGTTVEGFMPI